MLTCLTSNHTFLITDHCDCNILCLTVDFSIWVFTGELVGRHQPTHRNYWIFCQLCILKKCILNDFKGNWDADYADNAMELTPTANEEGKLTLPRTQSQELSKDKDRATPFITEAAYIINKRTKTEQSQYCIISFK